MITVKAHLSVSTDFHKTNSLRPLFQGLCDQDIEFFRSANINITEDQKDSIIKASLACIHHAVLATEEDGNVVGMVIVPNWDENLISEVYVVESHRRTGLGSRMLAALHIATGFRHRINVTYGNENAIKFYESLGFKKATIGMIQHD